MGTVLVIIFYAVIYYSVCTTQVYKVFLAIFKCTRMKISPVQNDYTFHLTYCIGDMTEVSFRCGRKPCVLVKASLTSHRTCTYVLVTERNRLICKGPLRYTCNFITEFQSCRAPTLKIDVHIILCVHAVCLQKHPCLKGNLRET